MRLPSPLIVLATLALVACGSDKTFNPIPDENVSVSPGKIGGRVCDPTGKSWLQDATVYTHITRGDIIDETRVVYTDRDGYWLIEDLPGDAQYDIFVYHGYVPLDDQMNQGVYVGDGATVTLDDPPCFDPLQINVAIIKGSYDDFARVLQSMGFANYDEIDGLTRGELLGFMSDLNTLLSYDVIFFDGGHEEEGIFYNFEGYEEDPKVVEDFELVQENLREYVRSGGSIYASDWSYDVIEQGWPDRLDFVGDDGVPDAAQLGEYGIVNAAVFDPSLADWLDADYLPIEYDLPVWAPIESVDTDSVSIHLKGNISYRVGTATYTLPQVPLLVSFSSGEGRVAYSTFRVAKNANAEILQVLQYMMYSL